MGRRNNKDSARTSEVTVTLVHGTYARNAAWTTSEGALHAALVGAGHRVVSFAWSGKNSHRARDRASSELAAHLESQIRDVPNAQQWIIAHSHGGNVALRAVAAVSESILSGVQISTIALATPFVHSRGRVLSIYQILMTVLFGIMLIAMGWSSMLNEPKTLIDWLSIIFALLFVATLTLCVAGLILHREKLGAGFRGRLVNSVHLMPAEAGQITVMRSAGDEASTFLTVGQFVGWLAGVTSRLLGSFRLWGFILITTQASVLLAVILDTRRLAFMQYVFAVPGLTLVALIVLLLSASLVFGVDGPFVSLFAFSSIEASPPGKAVLLQLEPFASEGRRLAHSRLYDDGRVIREILEAIRGSSLTSQRRVAHPRGTPQGKTENGPAKPPATWRL